MTLPLASSDQETDNQMTESLTPNYALSVAREVARILSRRGDDLAISRTMWRVILASQNEPEAPGEARITGTKSSGGKERCPFVVDVARGQGADLRLAT